MPNSAAEWVCQAAASIKQITAEWQTQPIVLTHDDFTSVVWARLSNPDASRL
jgi:hypothetical protein